MSPPTVGDSPRILLTGGSGLLGQSLLQLDENIVAPSHDELDIADRIAVQAMFGSILPDIVIHAAAVTENANVRSNPSSAIRTNIIGTAGIAMASIAHGIRLIYVSTDYVYPDTPGPHREGEPVKPANSYAWTKLGGECSVMLVPGSLIIRTTFGPRPCMYDRAATDKMTSRVYVDEVAPRILSLARSALTGVVNLGGPALSMYEHAKISRDNVQPVKIAELVGNGSEGEAIPKDTSLDLTRWRLFEQNRPDDPALSRMKGPGDAFKDH